MLWPTTERPLVTANQPKERRRLGGPAAGDVTAEVERRRPWWNEGSRGSRPVTTPVTAAMNRGSRHVGQQDNRRIQVESRRLAIDPLYGFAPRTQVKGKQENDKQILF